MTAATALVPVRACCPSVTLASLQHLVDALQARHHLLAQRSEDDICARTLDLDGLRDAGIGWRKGIIYSSVMVL